MGISIEILNSTHSPLIHSFSCVETATELAGKKSGDRKKIAKRSKEIDDFLKKEALPEQEANLNTTHLFIDRDINKLVGFVSLCNDSIPLNLEERTNQGICYSNVPALKIARLGVSNEFHHNGLGQIIIQYCAFIASQMREHSGVTFLTLDCYKHRRSFYEGKFGFVINNAVEEKKTNAQAPISMRLHLTTYLKHIGKQIK